MTVLKKCQITCINIFESKTTLSQLQSMIRDWVISTEKRLTTIDETKPEKRSKPPEDPFENNLSAAIWDIDDSCARNQPVRGISPVQIDMKEVFALLAENHLQLPGAEGQETSENQETDGEREVSWFNVL